MPPKALITDHRRRDEGQHVADTIERSTTADPRAAGALQLTILAVLVEKVIQHVAVTAAFALDFDGIRATVEVPWHVLAVAGAALAVLYALAFLRRLRRRGRARALVIASRSPTTSASSSRRAPSRST